MCGIPLIDKRENHRTTPHTVWFVSHTMNGRILKIVGIPIIDKKEFVLKSAFDADDLEIELYEKNQ